MNYNKIISILTLIIPGLLQGGTNNNYFEQIQKGREQFQRGSLDAAYTYYTNALEQQFNNIEALNELSNCLLHLGNEYFDRGQNKKALETFKKILLISDQFSVVYHNIAFTLAERFGDHTQALKFYEKALALDPDSIAAHFCASMSYLATGDLLRGFEEYEYRWKLTNGGHRTFPQSLINLLEGTVSLEGKTVLIRCEQGLGDTFHFIRYAQLLKNQGAFVIAEVQKPLQKILSLCPYIDQIIVIGQALPMFDYQIPLLSLPHFYKTTLQTIPATMPYLYADKTLTQAWHKKLDTNNTTFKIGICWHGDAVHGAGKFMPLRDFAPLFDHPHISVYSLQQVNGLEQIHAIHKTKIHLFDNDFDKEAGSFMDTAAVMKNLDLVISVDTSTAHLAAGLGIPTWVVLPFPAEWRWLADRCDSPWYPTMVLFRQEKRDEWQPVMQKIMQTLNALLECLQKKHD